jgi:hypothetical protein
MEPDAPLPALALALAHELAFCEHLLLVSCSKLQMLIYGTCSSSMDSLTA